MKCYLIGLLSMLSVHAAMGQQAIDVHCHNILPTFKELLDRHGATLEETFPLPDWDVASHLKFMKEAGIETSVLSMPAPQPWFGDVDEVVAISSPKSTLYRCWTYCWCCC